MKKVILIGPSGWGSKLSKRLLEYAQSNESFLIGVDGGVQIAHELGLKLHFAIGDWDSLKGGRVSLLLNSVPHQTLPQEKNRSDLFYALEHALLLACRVENLTCFGFAGGRPDQHLAMLGDLSLWTKNTPQLKHVQVLSSTWDYFFFSSWMRSIELPTKASQRISIFSLQGSSQGVKLFGLQYTHVEKEWLHSSFGMSNQALGNSIQVQWSHPNEKAQGCLVIMKKFL